MSETELYPYIAFIFGLILGSFYNVCIYRLPLEKSVVKARSQCPHCEKLIPWYCNIPVFSFLFLKGKCLKCKGKISIQYPLVELISGILFFWLMKKYGLTSQFFAYTIYLSSLLIITIIDLHHQIIPNEISLPGIIVGFLMCLWTGDITWWESILGVLCGGGLFFLIAFLYEKIAKREGLGGGDVKLLAMIGAWQGWQSIMMVVVISSAVGSVIGLTLMFFQKKDLKYAIPFGPFLALGALIYLIWGAEFNAWILPPIPE